MTSKTHFAANVYLISMNIDLRFPLGYKATLVRARHPSRIAERETTLPAVGDRVISGGKARPMILVMPNADPLYEGSMYPNSVTTGDWEAYIMRDLVSYVDARYRTIPNRPVAV